MMKINRYINVARMSRSEYGTSIAQTPTDVLTDPANRLYFNLILVG